MQPGARFQTAFKMQAGGYAYSNRGTEGHNEVSESHVLEIDHVVMTDTRMVVMSPAGEPLVDASFGILGRTSLRIGDSLDEGWGHPREHAVLAALLINAGKAVPIDSLVEWVWPEEAPAPQNKGPTFHTYATRIRRSLQRVDTSASLIAADGGYRLDVDRSEIDYYRFKDLMAKVRELVKLGQTREASEVALQAIKMWRGRPLDDLRTERARNWRHRVLVDDWLPANTMLLEALLDLGEYQDALARVDDLLVEHPIELVLAKVRLAALYGLARHSDAVDYFFDTRRQLLRGSDPLAAEHLRQFHDRLMGAQTFASPEPPQSEDVLVPQQLPHDPPDFVGREELLNALDDASTTKSGQFAPGIIIVHGMPGVGKTALAVHWAHRVRYEFTHGQLFVDLRGFSASAKITAPAVVDDFLIALGHSPDHLETSRAKEFLLARLLSNRRTVVVLDNARDSAHVMDLIPLLSSSVVIVTSRQKLSKLSAATGARQVRVEPMPASEATELMASRLGNRHDFDDDDRARMVALCGGLPLIITVLTGHVMTWPAAQISEFARRLDYRQVVSELGDDGDGAANIRTFFAWSYDQLEVPERRLFRLLGLHPSPDLSVEAAAACDGRALAATKRSLGVLVGAHLVEQTEALGRYQFHDLVHEFATLCVEHDEPLTTQVAARRRVIDHYLATVTVAHRTLYPGHATAPELPASQGVELIDFANTVDARAWLDRERTNLIAAIRSAANHDQHDQAWRLADTVASYLDRRGAYQESRDVRVLAVSSAVVAGDREATASSQAGLAMVLTILGDHQEARRCLDASLRFAEDTGNARGQASTLHLLGRLEMSRGDTAAAIGLYRRSLDIAQRIDDHEGLCWSHCRIGQALRSMDQYDMALVHLHQSMYHATRVGDGSAHASSLAEIGLLHADRGDYRTAIGYCEQALGVVDALAIPELAISTQIYTTLAEINLAARDNESARRNSFYAIVLAQRSHSKIAEARATEVLGDAHRASGEIHEALACWDVVVHLYQQTGNPARLATVRAKIDKTPMPVELPQTRSRPSGSDAAETTWITDHPTEPLR